MQVLLSCYIQLGLWSCRNVHASIGYLTGNVLSSISSEPKLSVLYYESLPDKIYKEQSSQCILLFSADSVCSMENKVDLKPWEDLFFFFFVLQSENESLMGELSWLRTSVASLEFTGRVSVYASVVNWLLSSRQSPTVAGIAAPLLAVVGLYSRRGSHTVHLTESMLSPQRWLVAPIISWWCKFFRKWGWAMLCSLRGLD